MLRFGYKNVNANLFTSAVEVYQVTFSVFWSLLGYVLYVKGALRSLTPIYFI